MLSGGIVGLNLDRRILSYRKPGSPTIEMPDSDFPFDEEYISEKELYLFYNAGNKDRVSSKLNEEHCITWERVEEGSTTATEKEYHLLHFLMHVAHFIKVAATSLRGIDVNKALTQICIGSDFDGLIHPIWCCLNTEELHILQSEFEKRFVKFANDINTPLPPGFDIKKFSQQLFFENGSNFIFGRLPLLVL